jgi:hypothetical protein
MSLPINDDEGDFDPALPATEIEVTATVESLGLRLKPSVFVGREGMRWTLESARRFRVTMSLDNKTGLPWG